MFGRVCGQNGAMPGKAQLQFARWLALHLDQLPNDPHVFPDAVVAVLVGVGRVQFVNIQILLVSPENRETEGDPFVMTDGDARQRRLPGPNHIHARSAQLHDVAQRRDAVLPVWIVGQNGPARRSSGTGHHPVVAADRVHAAGRLVEQGGRIVCLRMLVWRREHSVAGCQVVVPQHVARDGARVQAGRDGGGPGWIQLQAQPVGLHRPGGASDLGAPHLGCDVARQAVAADPDDIVQRPGVGRVARDMELWRQRLRAVARFLHEGVNALDEGGGIRPGVRPISLPFLVEIAVVGELPGRTVLVEEEGTEVLREQAQAALAPQVYLPQPVPRRVVALQEESIMGVSGEDVRDAPVVHDDLRPGLQACDGSGGGPGGTWRVSPGWRSGASQHHRGQGQTLERPYGMGGHRFSPVLIWMRGLSRTAREAGVRGVTHFAGLNFCGRAVNSTERSGAP